MNYQKSFVMTAQTRSGSEPPEPSSDGTGLRDGGDAVAGAGAGAASTSSISASIASTSFVGDGDGAGVNSSAISRSTSVASPSLYERGVRMLNVGARTPNS